MPAASNTGWPTANPEAGADPGTFTGLAASAILGKLDSIADNTRPRAAKPRVPFEACHPIWQTGQIPLVAGAGNLQLFNVFGPQMPYWWDLRTLSFWGFSAGTVSAFMNNLNGEQVALAVTTPGQFTWSGQMLMSPQDDLLFSATGVTGVVNVTVRAIEVETAWLPEYLM